MISSGMALSELSNRLELIPIPIIIVSAAVMMRQIATAGTQYNRPSELRKWMGYAAVTLGAGLLCGLYADGLSLLKHGWPHDVLSAFIGTLVFVIFAVAAMPVMVVVWLLSLGFKKLFGGMFGSGRDF